MPEWYVPRQPDEISPEPWLHEAVVEYLEQLVVPEWHVLEHGAGGSTLWFASRVAYVTTVEHNLEWREKVREMAPANVTILCELTDNLCGYDLFLIDGEREERGKCIQMAVKAVKPGGWIVLDNANRPEYAEERQKLHKVAKLAARFDNNVPWSKYFVTEVWKCG